MINLKQDIQDILDNKPPKDAAIFKIKLQPYFMTLDETCRELHIFSVSFKSDLDKLGIKI